MVARICRHVGILPWILFVGIRIGYSWIYNDSWIRVHNGFFIVLWISTCLDRRIRMSYPDKDHK